MSTISPSILNALATVVADTFNDGYLELYSGTPGATPDITSGGTLLMQMKLPIVAFEPPDAGVIAMAGQWFGTCAATGTAAWGRFCNLDLDAFLVVTVTNGAGGGQIRLATTSLVLHGVAEVTAFTYTIPAG